MCGWVALGSLVWLLWKISWLFFQMTCNSCATFISGHLNIKGCKMPHTFGTSIEEFGAAENLVIGKINNIYSGEMQICLRWGSMNNWVRTIILNYSSLNIRQCVFYDRGANRVLWQQQRAAAAVITPALLNCEKKSSFVPAVFFKNTIRWRRRVNNAPLTLPTHIPITETSCTASPRVRHSRLEYWC